MFTIIFLIAIKLTFLYLAYRFFNSFKKLKSGSLEELSKLKRLKTILKIAIIAIIPLIYLSSYVKVENLFERDGAEYSESLYEDLILGTWVCFDDFPKLTFYEDGEIAVGEYLGTWFLNENELILEIDDVFTPLYLSELNETELEFYRSSTISLGAKKYYAPKCRKL